MTPFSVHPPEHIMVFGVFDGFHKGHEYFLSEALKRCSKLTVVVAVPEMVELMKKKRPMHTLEDRIQAIKDFAVDVTPNISVIPGDATLGEWNVLKIHQPDMVILGYDQQGIAGEMERLGIPYEYINSYHPEIYKTSLMSR